MLRILHAADLHLDSPFRSLPPREAARRRREQRELPGALRDLALEQGVGLALLAGDLFDAQQVYPETLEALAHALAEFPCPVCIAPGNHDFWSPKSPYAARPWPGNVHIFSSETMTPLPLPALGVTVYGCAFTAPSRVTDPLAGFVAPQDGSLPLAVLHADVDKPGQYGPLEPASLARSGLRYAALGHVHRSSGGLQRAGNTLWAYPGCPQGRGFDETGDKGALLVEVDGEAVRAQFLPLPGPRYRVLTLDLTGQESAQALAGALSPDLREDYLRVVLTGEAEAPDLPALRALGEGRCRYLELRDATSVPRDVWARSGEDTLTGFFLREMSRRLGEAEEGDRPGLSLAARYGLAALEGREAPL